jgi:hypothetical protein
MVSGRRIAGRKRRRKVQRDTQYGNSIVDTVKIGIARCTRKTTAEEPTRRARKYHTKRIGVWTNIITVAVAAVLNTTRTGWEVCIGITPRIRAVGVGVRNILLI